MKSSSNNVRFSDLFTVCEHFFGKPRNNRSSHFIFETPWRGDPRINLQKASGNKAKKYQIKQALEAVERIERKNYAQRRRQ
ncbi:toxin HicA [Bartonella sp. F02]|uniref:toxin HicA n=1 Tax=Bartonella sp. F02 TaxID=2967262 RepID=UPI0022A9F3C5|nr:toxin HicA [Bartonella sp. F02]MCZ2328945.1 toxin HicA [Bartonella sp. F02]